MTRFYQLPHSHISHRLTNKICRFPLPPPPKRTHERIKTYLKIGSRKFFPKEKKQRKFNLSTRLTEEEPKPRAPPNDSNPYIRIRTDLANSFDVSRHALLISYAPLIISTYMNLGLFYFNSNNWFESHTFL